MTAHVSGPLGEASPFASQRPGSTSPFAQSPSGLAREGSGTMLVVKDIWPVMTSLFLSGVVGIMVFPFFTYVPSSGWLNDLLPKVKPENMYQHDIFLRWLSPWLCFVGPTASAISNLRAVIRC